MEERIMLALTVLVGIATLVIVIVGVSISIQVMAVSILPFIFVRYIYNQVRKKERVVDCGDDMDTQHPGKQHG